MGGLTRELFPLFWNSLKSTHFDGSVEKVPILTPKSAQDFFVFGEILSHGYVLTGYFPLFISLVCATYQICGVDQVSEEALTHSYFNFVDPTEATALKSCLSDDSFPEDMQDIVIGMLSRFNCTTIPSKSNFTALVNSVAQFTLFCQPHFALFQMRRGMIASHPSLWLSPIHASS